MHPNELNLFGDSANGDVLAYFLNLGRVGYELKPISRPVDFSGEIFNVLIVGHGSAAAWRSLAAEFAHTTEFIRRQAALGATVILVNSAIEHLAGGLGLGTVMHRAERTSEFVSAYFEEQTLVGYRNTAIDAADFAVHGNYWLTTLHGPLLAKNPGLVKKLLAAYDIPMPKIPEKTHKIIESARKLALDLAN